MPFSNCTLRVLSVFKTTKCILPYIMYLAAAPAHALQPGIYPGPPSDKNRIEEMKKFQAENNLPALYIGDLLELFELRAQADLTISKDPGDSYLIRSAKEPNSQYPIGSLTRNQLVIFLKKQPNKGMLNAMFYWNWPGKSEEVEDLVLLQRETGYKRILIEKINPMSGIVLRDTGECIDSSKTVLIPADCSSPEN